MTAPAHLTLPAETVAVEQITVDAGAAGPTVRFWDDQGERLHGVLCLTADTAQRLAETLIRATAEISRGGQQ